MLLVSPNERQAILILRMRDLKYRESKQFVQDHIAAKWQNHDSNPNSLTAESILLDFTLL